MLISSYYLRYDSKCCNYTENSLYLCQNDKHLFLAMFFFYISGIFSPIYLWSTKQEKTISCPNMSVLLSVYTVQKTTIARRSLVWWPVERYVTVKVNTEKDEDVLIRYLDWDYKAKPYIHRLHCTSFSDQLYTQN